MGPDPAHQLADTSPRTTRVLQSAMLGFSPIHQSANTNFGTPRTHNQPCQQTALPISRLTFDLRPQTLHSLQDPPLPTSGSALVSGTPTPGPQTEPLQPIPTHWQPAASTQGRFWLILHLITHRSNPAQQKDPCNQTKGSL